MSKLRRRRKSLPGQGYAAILYEDDKRLVKGRRGSSRQWEARSFVHTATAIVCVVALSLLIIVQSRSSGMRTTRPSWADPQRSADWTMRQRLTNFTTKGIRPLPCLSHNDESREIPLFTGLSYGCTAVEADIWLRGDELLVGHDANKLKDDQTLRNMYLRPLQSILEGKTGQSNVKERIYDERAEYKPFVLMLDFKSQGPDGADTLKALEHALHPLRQTDLLSHFDVDTDTVVWRPLMIVASGDVPFDKLTSRTFNYHRDIFFDAPLRWMWEDKTGRPQEGRKPGKGQGRAGTAHLDSAEVFGSHNSYYASMSFKSLYWPPLFGLADWQKQEIREQVEGAHKQGLKVRYWGTYDWALRGSGLRRLWRQLIELGVDVINVDDLRGFALAFG